MKKNDGPIAYDDPCHTTWKVAATRSLHNSFSLVPKFPFFTAIPSTYPPHPHFFIPEKFEGKVS